MSILLDRARVRLGSALLKLAITVAPDWYISRLCETIHREWPHRPATDRNTD